MENDMTKRWIFAVLLVCLGIPAVANAQPKGDASRGELLYTTHCIACHSTEIHWRDKKIAKDWVGLKAQVRRWQGVAGLAWSNRDIVEVARYLNAHHYHYPEHIQ
jgi:mono/diheme cytochrome c family protein